MYVKTDAIVLSHKKYRDNATLLTLYTKELGRCTFLLYGAGSKKGGKGFSLLQPLSLLQIDSDIRNGRELNVIKEVKPLFPLYDSLFDPYKSSILFFLAEVLSHALKTNERDDFLFQFLYESIVRLEGLGQGVSNFHIAFLVRLTDFLGFGPNVYDWTDAHYFDFRQAEYTSQRPTHAQYVGQEEARFLRTLCRINYRNLAYFRFSQAERKVLLDYIVEYYNIHLQGFGDLKTLPVLHEIFD